MNYLKNNLEIASRLGPKSGVIKDAKFVQRVKPLYMCAEKEVYAYAHLNEFGVRYTECPNAKDSFRAFVRDLLNNLEVEKPKTKENMVKYFLEILPKLQKEYNEASTILACKTCGQPSKKERCSSCVLIDDLRGKGL